jgi:hypothetical protein
MRILGKRYSTKEWARLAMTFGLFVTDAKIWSALNDQFRQRADDLGDLIRHQPDRTSVRNQQLRFRRNRDWMAHLTSLLAGLGVGIGVGMLLAPSSGNERCSALRNRVTAVKNNVGDAAVRTTQFHSEARPTGAVGD